MNTSWVDTLAVFDLETTGVDVETARVVTAFVGVIDAEGATIEENRWLADPGVEIPDAAAAVHGISTAHAREHGSPAHQVVDEIIGSLRELGERGVPVVIFNAPYDLSLLDREARRHGVAPLGGEMITVIDPLVIDKHVDRYRRGKRTLTVACEHYGVRLDDAHEARADAVAAGRLAQVILRRHQAVLPADPGGLHIAQAGWFADQSANFEQYMRSNRDPSFTASREWPQRLAPGQSTEARIA